MDYYQLKALFSFWKVRHVKLRLKVGVCASGDCAVAPFLKIYSSFYIVISVTNTAVTLLRIDSRIYGVSRYERYVTRTSYIREHT